MSNENVLLTQGGYIFPGSIGSYQPSPPLASYNVFPPQHILSSPPLVSVPSVDFYGRYSRLPPLNSPSSDTSSTVERDFRIIPWDELKSLLAEESSDVRAESGLLSDGRAFAQRSPRRDAYFLFPSKSAYILYFTHYYFSRENLDRDQTIRGMMLDNCAIAIDKIIEAPRLASIGTTIDDMKVAVESGSNILCVLNAPDGRCYLRRIDGYPGNMQTVHSASTLPVEAGTRASFDGSLTRGQMTERPVPSTSADLEFVSNLSAMLAPSIYGVQGPSPIDASLIYPTQNAFVRPGTRPPSAAAPVAAASAISTINAAMAGMNLGQPTPSHHHPAQVAPHLLTQLAAMPQHLAATLAAINQRNPVPAFPVSFGQNPFSTGQGRSTAPTHGHQSQIFHHQQQHRRATPPPPTSVPPPQTTSAASVAANVLNLQLPGAPYNFQNMHEAASSAHFVHGYPTHTYDSWIPEVTNAALVNNGIHLQYSPHIVAWPPQSQPTQLRSTSSSSVSSQHPSMSIQQQQPMHMYPPSANLSPVNLVNSSNASSGLMAPPANASTSVIEATGAKSAAPAPENSGNDEKIVATSAAASVTASKATNLGPTQASSSKDDSVNTAVKEAGSVETVNRRPAQLAQQVHSRPNSSGSGKTKFKSGKGGHHQRVTHSNRSPPSVSVVSTGSSTGASSVAAATSLKDAAASMTCIASSHLSSFTRFCHDGSPVPYFPPSALYLLNIGVLCSWPIFDLDHLYTLSFSVLRPSAI
ncbi:unnamed protein product [Hydatigera taeniaeformis]|uniref:HTH La-type RNA-binding domain-containing protein n=1 Tax=Hydatigena taeniaeformis TaxID=6205 RepID=A0A0R3X6U0_HYDTA|nr:unnamed protein product [Hydatigera taeniaeformis]